MTSTIRFTLLFLALIIFNVVWIGYDMIEYVSSDNYVRKSFLDTDFRETVTPFDGKISGIEYFVFYLICPMISCLILIELLKGMNVIETNNKTDK